VRLELTIGCARCARLMPLEAISSAAQCPSCLHARPLAKSDWAYIARDGVAQALAGEGDADRMQTDFGDDYTVRSRIGVAPVRCSRCQAEIDLARLAKAKAEVECACGHALSVREADSLARAIHHKVIQVVGERSPRFSAGAPVSFACAGCRATLAADGTSRTVVCPECGDVDVPRALWFALRPIQPRSAIHLLVGER
jgi:DNA-directed RNA polymerase subunit RPC12/RpoP